MRKLFLKLGGTLSLLLFFTATALAQLSGTVADQDGIGLPGVNITVVGTSSGTVTDLDGNYSINAPSDATLRFSYLGFEAQEIAVAGKSSINVVLLSDDNVLGEVLVIGYGSTTKESITGAVSSIGAKEVSALTVANLGEAVQGRLAGVQVTGGGAPGQAPIIQVRGIGSISFGSGPLYVVDGVPGAGGLNQFDSRDVESFTVLKDASATAIYGSRASNGVILIETKQGGYNQDLKLSLSSTVGIQTQNRRFDLLNTEQYINYAETLSGMPLARDLSATVNDGSGQSFRNTNTDWQDAIFQDGFLTQNHLSLAGGSDRSKVFASLGYLKQEGVMIGAPYDRYNFRINSEHKIGSSDKFRFGQKLLLVRDERFLESQLGGRTQLLQAVQSIPYQPIFDNDNIGGFSGADQSLDSADPGNPVLAANLLTNVNRVFKTLGTVYLEYDLFKGLTARALYGANYQQFSGDSFNPIYQSTVPSVTNQINSNRSNNYSPLYNGPLIYKNILGDHSIDATVVAEVQESYNNSVSASAEQSTNSINVIAGGTNPTANSSLSTTVLQSFVGRATYGFKGKYYATLSFRRDGSSIFAPGNQFENFPAAAVSWNISEEPFLQNTAVSFLKARASYGRTGSIGLGPFSFQAPINSSFGPVFGTGAQPIGTFINQLANDQLRWELTDMLNVGVDVGFLNNRLNFSAEYYNREVDNLILSVQLPPSVGVGSTLQNVGAMSNSGIEFQAEYVSPRTGDFQWSVKANLSNNTNEVLRLSSEDDVLLRNNQPAYTGDFNSTITRVGDPIFSFYGFQTDGLFQDQAEIDALNAAAGDGNFYQVEDTSPGDVKFVDLNGDGLITADDRSILGSYLPDFTYGVNFSGTYRKFDFSLFFQGTQGNDVYNGMASLLSQTNRLFNVGTGVLDAWTPQNTSTDIPRIALNDPNNNRRVSDRFLEDGSYLRVKNLTIGYNFDFGANSGLSSLRLFVTGQNLLTLTGYSGLDPEIAGGLSATGFDNGVYPQAKSFLFGAQVGF